MCYVSHTSETLHQLQQDKEYNFIESEHNLENTYASSKMKMDNRKYKILQCQEF